MQTFSTKLDNIGAYVTYLRMCRECGDTPELTLANFPDGETYWHSTTSFTAVRDNCCLVDKSPVDDDACYEATTTDYYLKYK